MRKSELQNLNEGKYYRATYKDFGDNDIKFRLKKILDRTGFKTKIYLEADRNEYIDLKSKKVKNVHCLNWLGLFDISKIKVIKEI